MIQPVIHDAVVYWSVPSRRWFVEHPMNGAVLAYCDTEAEARAYRDAINDLPRQLRAAGMECR